MSQKKPILPPSNPIGNQRPDYLSDEQLVDILAGMIRIREFEEKVQRLYMKGLIHGTTHLCQGQEAVSIGVATVLRPDDYVTVTYRSHGHSIARGMDMKGLFSELMGRATGICKGKGGSMHFTDFTKNVIGSFGIVGAGLPVALGAAMSAKYKGEDRVSVTFFGDGATNIGAFHESLNMAAVFKAPVIFVCENNIYGEFSRIDETTAVSQLSVRASAYNMPGFTINGNNVLEVMEVTREAVERARRGEGPTFIECVTYRQRGHSRTDPAKYRPEDEVQAWLQYDPIVLYKNWLIDRKIIDENRFEQLKQLVLQEIDEAAAYAEASPWPENSEIMTDIYA
jgi:acetoin:2,6-dichlorophenolindophenol oxidoreductase subunit alpha